MPTPTRLIFFLAAFSIATVLCHAPARAADPAAAAAFVKQTGNEFSAVVGDASTPDEKKRRLQPFVDKVVDVDEVARFCLGRFWNRATPEQQREYTDLFHRVLMNNIVGHMGDYKQTRVNVILGKPELRDGLVYVPTTIEREGNPPAHVTWIVQQEGNSYRIVDVVAEGTSMRLTVRTDYNSFLNAHNGNVDALIKALRSQAAG